MIVFDARPTSVVKFWALQVHTVTVGGRPGGGSVNDVPAGLHRPRLQPQPGGGVLLPEAARHETDPCASACCKGLEAPGQAAPDSCLRRL